MTLVDFEQFLNKQSLTLKLILFLEEFDCKFQLIINFNKTK